MSRILKFSRHPKWCDKIQTISDGLSHGQQQKNTHHYNYIICSLSNHPLCWPNSKFDCAIAWYNSAEIKTCLRGVFSLQTPNNIYLYRNYNIVYCRGFPLVKEKHTRYKHITVWLFIIYHIIINIMIPTRHHSRQISCGSGSRDGGTSIIL